MISGWGYRGDNAQMRMVGGDMGAMIWGRDIRMETLG